MKKIVFNLMGSGLGDNACAEPIIRYTKSMNMPYEIYILSPYKRLFEHLNLPVAMTLEELSLSPNEVYRELVASPFVVDKDGNHHIDPFALYAQPLFTSAVDFQSLFLLHRILPDEEKRVKLPVHGESIEKLKSLIAFPLRESIALHVGSGNKARLYTDDFYTTLTESLLSHGYQVILFGNSKPERAHVHLSHSNLLDLVDTLDLDLLITLLSQTKTLITNDSSPLHIASAFDNNIILLSAFKHPDRLLHIRSGSKYYKAKAFFNTKMVNERDIDITQGNFVYSTIEYKEGEKVPVPPLVSEVIQAIKELHG